ncbi:DsbA family protein [Patescibacteria group bacterium]|nr:DsbA family protein [Patescibacteria group bacterium]MBU1895313.1 DsbA family protein [Patescibacteria group bacterium]
MLKTRHLYLIFIPAIAIVLFVFLIRVIQYEPLLPYSLDEINNTDNNEKESLVVLFEDDPLLGKKKAPRTLIVFEDFGCESCATLSENLNELLVTYPDDVKVIWKMLPVTRFPIPTDLAHEYAYCANSQNKFEKFKDLAFANRDNLSEITLKTISAQIELNPKKLEACLVSPEVTSYFEKTEDLAQMLNIQAVPTVFYKNTQIQPPDTLLGWQVFLGL